MPARVVVLPATVLLVPGAAGSGGPAGPLTGVRAALEAEVAALTGPDGATPVRWGVLAPASRTSHGVRRASLAAAGIADRWVPALRSVAAEPQTPQRVPRRAAQVPASVALLVLADVVPGADDDAWVVELAADAPDVDVAAAAGELSRCDAVLVAGGYPHDPGAGPTACAPPVAGVLDALAGAGGWSATTRTVPVDGPHLPASYDVVTWAAATAPVRTAAGSQTAVSANQPTPASSSQNRAVRPIRIVGT